MNMQSAEFRFQPLPSTVELNTLTPTAYDPYHAKWLHSSPETHAGSAGEPSLHYEPIQFVPQSWLLRPESKSRTRFYDVVGFIGHILLTLSPIIFLMLAFAALSVDGKPLSQKGQVVLEAAKVAPTLFPIIFAAVVGRLMRFLALWRAEKGASLGLLEQLNGSQNMLAAVERAFHLQGLGGIGILVILLWCLSPLGGQSSLRVLEISKSGTSYQQSIAYFDTDNYTSSAFIGASALGWGWPTVSAIYQACLLAPDKVISSSSDLWGNVKIPLLQSLPGYNAELSQDWLDVPIDNTTYASLTGLMVSGLDHNTTANFTVETAYVNLSCSDPQYFQLDINNTAADQFYTEVRNWTGNLTYHSNTSVPLFTDPNPFAATDGLSWSSFIIDTNWNYTDRALVNQTDINMIYLSQNGDNYVVTGYNCSLGYSHVEVWVDCDGLECYVARMRPSRRDHLPPNITPFNQGFFNYYSTLISRFPWATGQQHASVTSPTDWYVAGSELPYNPSFGSAVYTNVSGSQVSRRLGTLINTLWQTSMSQSSLVQPPKANVTEVLENQQYGALSTLAGMQTQTDVYAVSKLWVSFTVIIALIMTFCGIAGITLKYITTVPDILGYVSSMTKDNTYFGGLSDDDSLDGMERTRRMQSVKVQIGNVKPWDQKGYIALRRIEVDEVRSTSRLGLLSRGDQPP